MNTANLFLDAAAPGTPVLGGSCKAASDGGTDPTGVGFQDLVLSLMGKPTEASEVWTGQQVDNSAVKDSPKQGGKDKAATDDLLGSTGDSQVLLGAMVAEAIQVNTAKPIEMGQAEVKTDGSATETVQTTCNAAPNDLLASQSANSWMSIVGTTAAASQPAQKTPVVETVTAPVTQRGSSEVNTSVAVMPAQAQSETVANTKPNVDTKVNPEENLKVDTKAYAKVDTKVETKVDAKVDTKVDAKVVDTKTAVDTKAEDIVITNQPTFDGNAVNNPKAASMDIANRQTGDVNAVSIPQAAEVQSDDKKTIAEDQTANPLIVAGPQVNPSVSNMVTPGEKSERSSIQPVSSQGIGEIKVELVSDTRSAGSTQNNKQDDNGAGTQSSQQIWNPAQDVKATTQNHAQAVNSTEPHLPPQQAVESTMIHQIVREAKVQLFDGGGTMTFRLDPPHLGSVNMSVSAHDGIITASLQTSTETARQALESGIGALKQSLADAGIVVDKINVSVGGDQNQNWSAQAGTHNGQSQSGSNGQSRFNQRFTAGPNIVGGVFDSPKSMSSQLDYLA